jgi:FtsX-like permease family
VAAELLRQLRHSVRLLARSPLFTVTAIASLAIGLGANTAIFTAANALLLAPTKHVRDMGHLVDIGRTTNGRGFDTVSFATYAYAVVSRAREIGIRMALGADGPSVVRLLLGQALRVVAIGGAIGLVLAAAVSRILTDLLFGISPLDPVAYGATVGLLAIVTLVATYLPARRAAAVDPLISLKAE